MAEFVYKFDSSLQKCAVGDVQRAQRKCCLFKFLMSW